jgi:hypothetical protein
MAVGQCVVCIAFRQPQVLHKCAQLVVGAVMDVLPCQRKCAERPDKVIVAGS